MFANAKGRECGCDLRKVDKGERDDIISKDNGEEETGKTIKDVGKSGFEDRNPQT